MASNTTKQEAPLPPRKCVTCYVSTLMLCFTSYGS